MGGRPATLFLCGDVMTGRGVDQILPRPGDPALREPLVRDARDYVALAERVNGRVPRPVDVRWPWGEALAALDDAAPDARIINLETSITISHDFAPGKSVHYRMHPANVGCVSAVRPDACVLANNHVLDFGRAGLAETLDVLSGAGLRPVGGGTDVARARRPVVVDLGEGRRLIVSAVGATSSGIPRSWAAGTGRPGIRLVDDLLDGLSDDAAADVVGEITGQGTAGGTHDIVVVSIHWGANWGYEVPPDQVRFAHRLIDAGVDVVHGHSSHHPRPVEVYRDRLILYGCGDLIDDYEGITGYEAFRPDLRLLWLPRLDAGSGRLLGLTMIPMQARRLRLRTSAPMDARWMAATLSRAGRPFASRFDLDAHGLITLA